MSPKEAEVNQEKLKILKSLLQEQLDLTAMCSDQAERILYEKTSAMYQQKIRDLEKQIARDLVTPSMAELLKELAEKLIEERREHWTQRALAAELTAKGEPTSQQTIQQWESRGYKQVKFETLIKVCEILQPGVASTAAEPGQGDPPLVILVDDNPQVLDATAGRMKELEPRWIVRTASGLDELEEMLPQGNGPDIVVTDLLMDGDSKAGIKAAELVERRSPGTPVILITGHPAQLDPVEATRAKIVSYFTKTTDGDLVESVLRVARKFVKIDKPSFVSAA